MDKKYWIQLSLSILLPLSLSGGLVIFREHLPQLLYIVFLWVLWVFIIVVLLRLAFGDWIHRGYTWTRRYLQQRARQKIVKEWHAHWIELRNLLSEVMDSGWQPAKEHNVKYSSLRSWFIANRSKSLPKWQFFHLNRTETAYEGLLTTDNLEYVVIHKNYRDPFSYFYEPKSLESLHTILSYINEEELKAVLRKLTELTDEFVQWIKCK